MPDSISDQLAGSVESTLDAVARSLREASERTHDLSEEASGVLSNAAADVVRIAEQLRNHAVDAAKDVARQATHEVQQHPIASIATALTAVAALVGVIAATRGNKSASK
jgi:ElaB/YqjD/DUF883 family membrane-anchored ribosome-binding protein